MVCLIIPIILFTLGPQPGKAASMRDEHNIDSSRYTLALTGESVPQEDGGSPFPWPADRIQEYTAYLLKFGHIGHPGLQKKSLHLK